MKLRGLTGTNTLSVVSLAEKTVNTSNRERETSLGRTTSRPHASASLSKQENVDSIRIRTRPHAHTHKRWDGERGEFKIKMRKHINWSLGCHKR